MPCEDGHAVTETETGWRMYKPRHAKDCRQYQKPRERHGTDCLLDPSLRVGPANTLSSDFYARDYFSVVLSYRVCGTWLRQSFVTNTSPCCLLQPCCSPPGLPVGRQRGNEACGDLSSQSRIKTVWAKKHENNNWYSLWDLGEVEKFLWCSVSPHIS